MYNAYVKEKENLDIIDNEHGFAAYQISKYSKTLDIGDFYVKPESRNGIKAIALFQKIEELAKEKGCNKISCCVILSQLKPEDSLAGVLRVKFKYSHTNNDTMYFYKKLEE